MFKRLKTIFQVLERTSVEMAWIERVTFLQKETEKLESRVKKENELFIATLEDHSAKVEELFLQIQTLDEVIGIKMKEANDIGTIALRESEIIIDKGTYQRLLLSKQALNDMIKQQEVMDNALSGEKEVVVQ